MHLSQGLSRRQPQGVGPNGDNIDPATSTTTSTQPPVATSTPASSSNNGNKASAIIPVVAAIVAITALFLGFFILRSVRRKYKNPKYLPTSFLKKRWERWDPSRHHYQLPDANDHLEPISPVTSQRLADRSSRPPSALDGAARNAAQNASNTAALGVAGVDRNTSVRSVMTLPAYNQHAMQNEQVLAREGERGGIDVVIEFPEGAEEEEARREEEMEALYQVRVARRRENEEREERRRLRREARERGDYVALRELQARARASSSASAGRTVEELRAEHERIKKERQRAVSSVSYADLGVARHDGTRLRASSMESEREGLLGDAASIAASSQYHRRERSASSILTIDTMNSDPQSLRRTRSRANSRGESSLRRSSSHTNEDTSGSNEGRAGSSPEIIEHEDIPLHSPPGYENVSLDTPLEQHQHQTLESPPGYSSPVAGRGEGSRALDRQASSSSSTSTPRPAVTAAKRSTRGIGGVPQLPSLRLASLPSIHIESASPTVRRIDEDVGQGFEDHHPEE